MRARSGGRDRLELVPEHLAGDQMPLPRLSWHSARGRGSRLAAGSRLWLSLFHDSYRPEIPRGLHHGQDVFDRHLGLDVVDRTQDVAAAGSKIGYPLPDLLPDIRRGPARQHAMGVDAPQNVMSRTVLVSSIRRSMSLAVTWTG